MFKTLCKSIAAILIILSASHASAGPLISGADRGPAIGGFDPVAYFTDQRPVRGDAAYTADWNDAVWHFASAANRDLFIAMPERYAPQYGGYCAFAAAQGSIARGDGRQWRIVDDKLYLNNNWFAQKLWQLDVAGNLEDSEQRWPQVKAKIEAKPDAKSEAEPEAGPAVAR